LKADSRACGGIDLGKGCFEKLQSLVGSSSESDPYEKVAEEMLLCEVIVQRRYVQSTIISILLMRVPCSRMARSPGAAAADGLFRYSSVNV
jgi:hypothetical protein